MSLLFNSSNGLRWFFTILFGFIFLTTRAQEELGVYEKLDSFLQDSLIFTDDQFEKVNLKNAVTMPTVVAMVYYECPGICTPLMNGLADVMSKSDLEVFLPSALITARTPLWQETKRKPTPIW